MSKRKQQEVELQEALPVEEQADAQLIYAQYQRGVDYLNKFRLYEKTEEAYRMYIGDQWYGLEAGGERLPIFNIIQPVVKYKVATVAANHMNITYTPMGVTGPKRREYDQACTHLNRYAAQQWELMKMDALNWRLLEDACIGGGSYLYFYAESADDGDGCGSRLGAQIVDAVSIHFANEQEADLQSQAYIILAERRPVQVIRAEAQANGLPEELVECIGADQETQHILGDAAKQEIEEQGGGKCLSLLKMWKENGEVRFCRSTQQVVYQPPQTIPGLHLYPVASMVWLRQKSSARGRGEVAPLVANQIELNKNLARRIMNAKMSAFNRLVYNAQMIQDPAALEQIGSVIRVDGSVAKVQEAVTYLAPQSMSPDVKLLSDELMYTTRELAGAGDAALGQVNPEKASGAAIIAVRDQAALPLNKQVADYRQFVEDVAAIWYDMWAAYHTGGLLVAVEGEDGESEQVRIEPEVLHDMKVHIRIDISPTSPITKYAQEQALESLFLRGHLSFEEYVYCLSEDSSVPKERLQEIIDKRRQEEERQAQDQAEYEQMLPQEQAPLPMQALPPMPQGYGGAPAGLEGADTAALLQALMGGAGGYGGLR